MSSYAERTRGFLTKTKILTWMKCPRQYHYQYELEQPYRLGWKAASGIALHDALEAHNREKLDFQEGHVSQLTFKGSAGVDLFEECWFKTIQELDPRGDRDDPREHVARLWPVYMQKYDPQIHVVAVEKEEVFNVAGVPMKGHIDLIRLDEAMSPLITDYKFSGRKLNAHEDIGSVIYSLATGIRSAELIQWYRKRVPEIRTVPHIVSTAAQRKMMLLIQQIHRWEQTGIYPFAETGHWVCSEKWCPFWNRCCGNPDGPELLTGEVL